MGIYVGMGVLIPYDYNSHVCLEGIGLCGGNGNGNILCVFPLIYYLGVAGNKIGEFIWYGKMTLIPLST